MTNSNEPFRRDVFGKLAADGPSVEPGDVSDSGNLPETAERETILYLQDAMIEFASDAATEKDALPVGETSEAAPAPRGVAGAFNDEVAVGITEVERFPPPCFEGHSDTAGHDCVRFAVQIASEPSEKPRSVFGRFLDRLIIDGQDIGVPYDDRGFRNPESGIRFVLGLGGDQRARCYDSHLPRGGPRRMA